jgi:hypothetical protein
VLKKDFRLLNMESNNSRVLNNDCMLLNMEYNDSRVP